MTRLTLIVLFVAVFVLYSCEAQDDCTGGPHDVRVGCGSFCEPTCNKQDPGICILNCAPNACRCESGYYRRERDGLCVSKKECEA